MVAFIEFCTKKTPNQILTDNDDQMTRHINDSIHHQQVYKTVPFNAGDTLIHCDTVRKLEQKEN